MREPGLRRVDRFPLTFLALAAFPRRSTLLLGLLLSGSGALIEMAQTIPILHRDSDFWTGSRTASVSYPPPHHRFWFPGEDGVRFTEDQIIEHFADGKRQSRDR